MNIYRELSKEEVETFQKWVDDNYTPFDDINDVWHPVVKDRCNWINNNYQFPKIDAFLVYEYDLYSDIIVSGLYKTIEDIPQLCSKNEFLQIKMGNETCVGSTFVIKPLKWGDN